MIIPVYKKTWVVIKIKPLNPQNDQLSIGLLAQLVEPCTGIAEVMSSTPAQAYVFHRGFISLYCYLTIRATGQ